MKDWEPLNPWAKINFWKAFWSQWHKNYYYNKQEKKKAGTKSGVTGVTALNHVAFGQVCGRNVSQMGTEAILDFFFFLKKIYLFTRFKCPDTVKEYGKIKGIGDGMGLLWGIILVAIYVGRLNHSRGQVHWSGSWTVSGWAEHGSLLFNSTFNTTGSSVLTASPW